MKRLITLGDSITYGYPYDKDKSWVSFVQDNLKEIEILNKGISGDTLEDMNNRLKEDVLKNNPDYVVLMGGINDVLQGYTDEEIKSSFKEIARRVNEEKKIIIILPTVIDMSDMEARLKDIRSWLIDFCEAEGIFLINLNSCLLDDKRRIKQNLFVDEIHPNIAGYKEIGKLALEYFKKFPFV